MTAILANAKDFLINSDYPVDKVILLRSYSIPLAALDFEDLTYAHGLSFTPLVVARWSTNSNLIPTYSILGGPTISSGYAYTTRIWADSTNINLSVTNNTASAVTLYFSVYGFMPSTDNDDVTPTASSADNFTINSDYNYTKLYLSGTVSLPTGTGSQTVLHSLGYNPQVSLWMEQSSSIYPVIYNAVSTVVPAFNEINYYITTTGLVIDYYDLLSARTIHYRIYMDE